MKEILLRSYLIVFSVAIHFVATAQCNETSVLKGSKTSFLDEKRNLQRTKEAPVIVTISKTHVALDYGDAEHSMKGDIISRSCDWTTPYKVGSMVIKVLLKDPTGITQEATFTIAGEADKLTLAYVAKERPGVKILVVADSFQAKKI